jgi:RimJ/RimL family protein N-acetyltransferase
MAVGGDRDAGSYTRGMTGRITDADLPVETERLVLRRFRHDDAASLLELWGNPDAVRYLYGTPLAPEDLDAALASRMAPEALSAESPVLKLAAELRESGELVGEMSLFHRSEVHARGEIGYIVAPHHAGQGLATEAAQALLTLGFSLMGFHRIEGNCDARNLASSKVMEAVGMRREAHFVENEFVKGEWTDALVFAMLAEEWRGPRAP